MGYDTVLLEVDTTSPFDAAATSSSETASAPSSLLPLPAARLSAAFTSSSTSLELLRITPAPVGTGGGSTLHWRLTVGNAGTHHAMTTLLEAFDVTAASVVTSGGGSDVVLPSVDAQGRDATRFALPIGHVAPASSSTVYMTTRVATEVGLHDAFDVRVKLSANGGSVGLERVFKGAVPVGGRGDSGAEAVAAVVM